MKFFLTAIKAIGSSLCLLGISNTLSAQSTLPIKTVYVFSSAAGTYSAITGGTVLGTTANDDQV